MSSLKIDISNLLSGAERKLQWTYNKIFCVDEIGFKGPITASLTITNIEKQIILSGELKYQIPLQCSRCLETYSYSVSEEIDEYFIPASTVPKEGKELPLEELSIFPYEGEHIELGDILRQYVILSRPERLLCKENCTGLCVKCGQNLNIKKCQCKVEETDPRWSALKNFTKE